MTQLRVQVVACNLILQNPSMRADQLATLVKEQLPTSNCSANSIAWYKSKLRKGAIKGFTTFDNTSFTKGKNLGWPEWSLPSNDDLLALAKLTVPYICFLHPDIVRVVVKDNEARREEWSDRLKKHGIDPALYLWQHSPCAFPGVRRYAGSTEIAQHRGRMAATSGPKNAIKLDDNDYPKHIWSFIFQGKRFQKHGPSGYSLAHLVDHKNYKNRGQAELDNSGDEVTDLTLFGLYTSVTNAVYMPNGLIRPTDFAFLLRNLIQRKADAIYGHFCKLLPPHLSFRTNESGAWSLDAFDWREPVGITDHLQAFLRYRNEKMETLFETAKITAAKQSPSAPTTVRPIWRPFETIMTDPASPEAGRSGLPENRYARSEARGGAAPRNFNCPMTDYEDPCTNGDCKRDKCIPLIEDEESFEREMESRSTRPPAPVPGEGPVSVEKIRLWARQRHLKVHRIIAIATRHRPLSREWLVREIDRLRISRNSYGAVASLMTNSGNNYGLVFVEKSEILSFHPQIEYTILQHEWEV